MSLKFLSVAVCALLCADTVFVVAQDAKPVTVPEKIMASRLQIYSISPLPKPPLTSRCSNSLAVAGIVIGADGKVLSADYVSGFSELKDTTIEAVQKWSYTPYLIDGKPTAVRTNASISYLGDGEAMPVYVPDGNGGVKGGNILQLPPDCGPGPQIIRQQIPLGNPASGQTAVEEGATTPDSEADKIYVCHVGADMICPKLTYSVDPSYGPVAHKARLEGTVLISLTVGTDGRTHDVTLVHSIRDGLDAKLQEAGAELDQHAIDAVRQYRFQPGSLKGIPVPMTIKAEVAFQLR